MYYLKEKLSINSTLLGVLLLFSIWNQKNLNTEQISKSFSTNIVVLSEEHDAYFSLGQEIAKTENAILITSVDKLNDLSPKYLIYVAAPNNISEKRLLKFSRFFKNSRKYPAFGIITGKSIESARNLWQRRNQARQGKNIIATDADYGADIVTGTIFDASSRPFNTTSLNKINLINSLKNADYFYWGRHVSYTKWFWNKKNLEYLQAEDLPNLKPVVIHTPSCNSLLPSKIGNIALEFVEKGAAAYIGHLYTPAQNSGVFIGHLQYIPGKYTWNDFPIGIMTQIQNGATIKASSHLPYLFMLGDPRISFAPEKPYTIFADQIRKNKRFIHGQSDKIGVLPLLIENGASYSFTKMKGLSSVSDKDLFYNSMIQVLDIQSDKYLLFLHNGGQFEIELNKTPSLLWIVSDVIKDALDYSWISRGVTKSMISLIFLLIFLIIVLLKIRRKKSVNEYLPELLFALLFALVQFVFVLYRMKLVTVSSYLIRYSTFELLLGFLGTFSMAASGMIVIHDAKNKFYKLVGLCLCVLPQFLLTLLYFLVVSLWNLFYLIKNSQHILLWNWNPVLLPLIVLMIELSIFGIFYLFYSPMDRTVKSTRKCI